MNKARAGRSLRFAAMVSAGMWLSWGQAAAQETGEFESLGSSWKTSEVKTGNWNNEDNWEGTEGMKAPYNRTLGGIHYIYSATIGPDPQGGLFGGIQVYLDMPVALGSLNVGGGVNVIVSPGLSIVVERYKEESGSGKLSNGGLITVTDSSLGFVSYDEEDEEVKINGQGRIVLNGGMSLSSTLGGFYLVHGSSHVIEGSGRLSVTNRLTNRGVIRAGMFQELWIDPPALTPGMTVNEGMIEAVDGGVVRIRRGLVDNTGGVIRAKDGSVVEFSATIAGGTLSTSGTGVLRSGTGTLQGTTKNTGLIEVGNGRGLWLARNPLVFQGGNVVTNDGTISVESSGSLTQVVLMDDMALEGTGVLRLSDNGQKIRVIGQASDRVLTNGAGHTIEGSGQIGTGSSAGSSLGLGLLNKGVIRATQIEPLIVSPSSSGVWNEGVLEADGGKLRLAGGLILNTGGVIRHQNGSTVELSADVTIAGGMLDGSGGGAIRIAEFGSAALDEVTLQTTLVIPRSGTGYLQKGPLTNHGELSMQADESGVSYLRLRLGDVTLGGTGTLRMNNSVNNYVVGTAYAGAPQYGLTNGADHTIRGSGNLAAMSLANQGLIWADQGVPLVITPNASGLTNQGTLRAGAGATLAVASDLKNYDALNKRLSGGRYEVTGRMRLANADVARNAAWIELIGPESSLVRYSGGADVLANLTENEGGGVLRVLGERELTTGGDLTNAGQIQIGARSVLRVGPSGGGTYLQVDGVTSGAGTLEAGVVQVLGGVLSPGLSPGELTILGDLVVGEGGRVEMEIGGTQEGEYDRLVVTGSVVLGGELVISLGEGFVPGEGFGLDLFSFGSVAGGFSSVVLPTTSGGVFSVEDGRLNFAYVPEPGCGVVLAFAAALGGFGRWRGRMRGEGDWPGACVRGIEGRGKRDQEASKKRELVPAGPMGTRRALPHLGHRPT